MSIKLTVGPSARVEGVDASASWSKLADALQRVDLGPITQSLRPLVEQLSRPGLLADPHRLLQLDRRGVNALSVDAAMVCGPASLPRLMPPKPPAPLLAPPEQPGGPGRRVVYLIDIIEHLERSALLPVRPALLHMRDRLHSLPSLFFYHRGRVGDWALVLRAGPEFFENCTKRAAADDPLEGDYGSAMRSIAILASDAAALFGYGVEPVTSPAPVVPPHLATTPDPGQTTAAGQPGAPTPADRRRAAVDMLRELESRGAASARQQVADTFGVALRTVGKWLEAVEAEEREARRSQGFGATVRALGSR